MSDTLFGPGTQRLFADAMAAQIAAAEASDQNGHHGDGDLASSQQAHISAHVLTPVCTLAGPFSSMRMWSCMLVCSSLDALDASVLLRGVQQQQQSWTPGAPSAAECGSCR